MANDVLEIAAGILIGNCLTIMLGWGMLKAMKIGAYDAAPMLIVIAIAFPCLFIVAGVLLWGR